MRTVSLLLIGCWLALSAGWRPLVEPRRTVNTPDIESSDLLASSAWTTASATFFGVAIGMTPASVLSSVRPRGLTALSNRQGALLHTCAGWNCRVCKLGAGLPDCRFGMAVSFDSAGRVQAIYFAPTFWPPNNKSGGPPLTGLTDKLVYEYSDALRLRLLGPPEKSVKSHYQIGLHKGLETNYLYSSKCLNLAADQDWDEITKRWGKPRLHSMIFSLPGSAACQLREELFQ